MSGTLRIPHHDDGIATRCVFWPRRFKRGPNISADQANDGVTGFLRFWCSKGRYDRRPSSIRMLPKIMEASRLGTGALREAEKNEDAGPDPLGARSGRRFFFFFFFFFFFRRLKGGAFFV